MAAISKTKKKNFKSEISRFSKYTILEQPAGLQDA
jgi:hypothetical protein